MARLKPYPAYKDSGLPWLECLPVGWSILRGKNVFNVVDVRSETGEEELLTVSSSDGVVPRSQKTVTMFKAESYVGHKLCWPGDLAINSLWAWMQGLGFSKYHGLVSSAYGVYRPKPPFAPQWLFLDYLLRSAAYKWELQTRSKGVWLSRLQLSDPAFLDMPIIVPPPEDAAAIVRFLDHVDQRIRRYIAAKKKLIALLNEQKQAIIHRAVTRGLDPNVRLKPSGVKWLGDVPEHWQITRLVRLATRIGDGLHGTPEYVEQSEYHFINGNNLSGGSIKITPSTRCVGESEFRKHRVLLDDSSVLMSINGTIGNLAFYRGETLILGKSAAYINCDKPLSRDFLFFSLQSSTAAEFFQFELTGTTILNLSLASIRNLPVAMPPFPEQLEISSFLYSKIAELDEFVAKSYHEIDLIREYRTRLIADVVTGKLDVRQAAARLLEEPEGPEALEEMEETDGDEIVTDDDQEEEA